MRRAEGRRLGYQPGLDGLRAIAVIGVLVFHESTTLRRFGRGGQYGVDVFFVLSGFLITSLLLEERVRAGRVSFRRFWARRARRLLPALVLMLALAALLTWFAYPAYLARSVHDDFLPALFYFENWHIVFGHGAAGSPIGHTWSLSVEEQFYLVWPLLLTGLYVLARGRRWPLAWMVGALAATSALVTALWLRGPHAYFGTDARAQEVLVGAALAVVSSGVPVPSSVRARKVIDALGVVGLLFVLALFATRFWGPTEMADGRSLVLALATAAVIAAAVQPAGVVRRVLGSRPLVAVGLVSYGLYLFHIPIYRALDFRDLPAPVLIALELMLTAAVALVSYLLVERPIRREAGSPRLLLPAGAALATVAFVVTGALVVAKTPRPRSPVLAYALGSAGVHAPAGSTHVLVVGGTEAALLSAAGAGPVHRGRYWIFPLGAAVCGVFGPNARCRALVDDVRALASSFRAPVVALLPGREDVAVFTAGGASGPRTLRRSLDRALRDSEARRLVVLLHQCPAPDAAGASFDAVVSGWAGRHRVAVRRVGCSAPGADPWPAFVRALDAARVEGRASARR